MTMGSDQSEIATLGSPRPAPAPTGVLAAIVVLALVEVVSAFYVASLNPVRGYDENAYAINAFASLIGTTRRRTNLVETRRLESLWCA